ncbi:MAG: ABC transporter substrate-binding protein [Cyanobacteria bacterium P01_D01_bin.36]
MGLAGCDGEAPPREDRTPSATSEKSGGTVTILGAVTGEQQKKLEQTLQPFEEATGIDVIYEGSDDFADLLPLRVGMGQAPDLAMFPQPGLMEQFVKKEQLIPLTYFLESGALQAAYTDSWLDIGTIENEVYAIWYRASVKSLVWYKPTAFEANGYDVPQTWPELTALSNKIAEEGKTPWCIGLESGTATGWPGTDWIEDIMLRTAGPEAYSQWIDHRLPFNSPQVINAFEEFGKILRNPKYVEGGTTGAVQTSFGESPNGLFTSPPECYMHRQASFIASFFAEGKSPRSDYDVFPLPGIDERFGLPILVAGDAFGMFNNTPESRALIAYLATPTPHEIGAQLGGFISPHRQISIDSYPDAVSQKIALILSNADIVQFDASDMMPSDVGTGTFWQGITDFAAGKSAEDVAKEIDASWPK